MVTEDSVSKAMLPASRPARVEVRLVRKKAKNSPEARGDLNLFEAADWSGDTRMIRPAI